MAPVGGMAAGDWGSGVNLHELQRIRYVDVTVQFGGVVSHAIIIIEDVGVEALARSRRNRIIVLRGDTFASLLNGFIEIDSGRRCWTAGFILHQLLLVCCRTSECTRDLPHWVQESWLCRADFLSVSSAQNTE